MDDKKIINDVVIGLNDNLFLFQGNHCQFDYLLQKKVIENKAVDLFFKNYSNRNQYCSKRAIKYLHIVFPSKPVLMTDYIPAELSNIKSLFLTYFSNKYDNIIYPIDLCMEEDNPCFKYDTHTTDSFNFCVINQILRAIDCPAIAKSDFTINQKQYCGDLYVKVKDELSLKPEMSSFFEPNYKFLITSNGKCINKNTNNIVIMHNKSAMTEERLLIFGDSYMKNSLKFFSKIFTDVVYVRTKYFHYDLVDLMNPSCVISENAERYLASISSDKHSDCVLLEHYGDSEYSCSELFNTMLTANFSYRYHHFLYRKLMNKIEQN